MNKFKQCTYTIMLMVTCFVASPVIFHKIWTNSSEAKKPVEVPPPVVDSSGTAQPGAASGEQPAVPTAPDGTPQQPVDPAAGSDAVPADGTVTFTPAQYVEADKAYFSDALFIGDSRTVGIYEYGFLKNADYFCDIGLAASKMKTASVDGKTFEDVIKSKQYGKVYIMLGINEVGNDFETTVSSYRWIIERVKAEQPDAIIYLQANLHVSAAASSSVINNDNINYLNSRIASLADYDRVFYIDINPVYDDEYGCLTAAYTFDGIHPLAEYYTQWCEWLCQTTVPQTAQPATDSGVVFYYEATEAPVVP